MNSLTRSVAIVLCRFAGKDERLFTATSAGLVRIWGKGGELLHERQFASSIHFAEVSLDGDWVAVVAIDTGRATELGALIWRIESDTVVPILCTHKHVLDATVSRDRSSLFIASTSDYVAGAIDRYAPGNERLTPLAEVEDWWADGDPEALVFALARAGGAALRWNHMARTSGLPDWPDTAREVRMNHAGTLVVAFPRQGWYARDAPSLWSASTLAHHGELASCLMGSDPSFVFTPDDALVAVADRDALLFFHADTGRRQSVLRLEDARSVIRRTRFCPVGALVALAVEVAGPYVVQVWDWKTGSLALAIPTECHVAPEVTWSSDGSRLAAVVDDQGTVALWSATTSAEVGSVVAG